MSGCNNYAENLWKKGKCSNCFRSKEQHFIVGTKDVHSNGDSRLLKTNHEVPKSQNIKPNELSNRERQTSSEDSADGGELIVKGIVKRAGKVYQAPSSEFSKRLSSYQATLRNDSSSGETQNTAFMKEKKETTDPLDKPKLVSSPTMEGIDCKSSHDSEDGTTSVRCSAWSSESSITQPKTHLHDSKTNVNNDNQIVRCAAADADLYKEKESSRNKIESDDIKHNEVTKRDANVKELTQHDNSMITQRKITRKEKDFTMNSKYTESNGKEGEYMQMKNNVCRGMEDDNKTDVDPKDKIQSANTCELTDKTQRIINKDDSLTSTNKQNGVKHQNNIIKEDSTSPLTVTNGARHINHRSSSCERQETLNLEPHYENRRSIDSDGRERSSSSSPLLEKPSICSVMPVSDRPESIALDVQSDLGELRESSIFEDIVVESSERSSSDSSKASSSISSSLVTDTKTSTELQRNKSSNGNGNPFDSHPKPSKEETTLQRWHSNPDVTKLVEGPCYANADAKPMTKPYKVVDISAGVPVHCNENEHADTPPLPPKEKELNRQKENSFPDHYYCEPPDDIVPDYKMLTPQNKDPPPIEIKKDPENRLPILQAAPVPRPRSQLPSHSATLPRPVPRAVKVEVDVRDVTRSSRPVSQVVTRTHKKEAPKPPSTSSIPSRKNISDFTPPTSPTEKHSPTSPECSKYQGSSSTVDSKDSAVKPKRMAPPPPKAMQATGRVSSQKEIRKESPRSSPTPSPGGQYQQPDSGQSNKAQSKSGSGIKRALSSWKRLSGRRKNKRKLEISSPIPVNEEIESYAEQQKAREAPSSSPVCTNIKERQRDSTILSQNPPEEPLPVLETEIKETQGNSSPQLPARKPGRSYQNFPFSKTDIEKPAKPSRPARAVKPVVHVKPEVNQNRMSHNTQHEAPAYLEPCTGELTLKVEAALANLNDAKILAETLTRVEQEKLGPLPEVPRSRHVHFRFNETANKAGKPAPKQSPKQFPKRPVTAVAPTVVNRQTDTKCRQPKYPSRPPNTKTFASDEKKRSKSVTDQKTLQDRTGDTRPRSLSTQDNPVKKRYDKILELHRQTLEDMINSIKAVLLPGDNIDLSSSRWNDYVICGSAMDIEAPGAVSLPVVCPKVDEELTLLAKVKFPKSVTEDMSQRTAYMQDMAATVSLPSHPNVSRTITHFTDSLQGEVFGLKKSSDFETLVTITDQVPVESVLDFVERTKEEHRELPDEYERKVCILLLQLLSALVHLHEEGIVHRDIRLNNLVLLDHGHLVLSNFSHVLQNSEEDASSSRFEYNIDSVGHIGRDPCRIPPEIHKAYNCGKLMNYEKCDVFAVGCLIYELLHEKNPFAVDSSLLTQDYPIHDLPMLTETSRFTSGLAALASGLLQSDPQMRMLPHEALKLLQAYLWGPEDLDESCLESSASDWLETERAHAVIMIARTQSHGTVVGGDEFLENFLKYEYLVTLTEDVVLEGYRALVPQKSPTLAACI